MVNHSANPRDSTSILKALPGKLDIKRRSPGILYEPLHDISHHVVCATSKVSDQPPHTRSLIRAFASRLNIL